MKISENEIRILKWISVIAGIFTTVVALTMIFGLVQLRTVNPLDNPSIQSVREQFDNDPESKEKAEIVRAMDLMARKAYFSSRWQVETGSYLLLAGAIIFVLCQRIIAGSEKPARSFQPDRPDIEREKARNRRYLLISAGSVVVMAVISSFMLRSQLPAPGDKTIATEEKDASPTPAVAIEVSDVNYPFFRGEGSQGKGGGEGYPTEFNGTEGKNIKWKTKIPQQGQSSPVIWGDKLFLTGAGKGALEVYCIDKKSGEILWTGSGSGFPDASTDEPESDADAGMAVPTAALTKNKVCAIFGNGNLVCFNHDGKLLWGKNIGIPQSTYAFSASLLISGDILLVQYDSQTRLSLIGFDLNTGEQKWETPRQGREVNSSPVLANFNGQTQVIINGNPNVSAYDPDTGRELWSLPGVSGDVAPSLAVNSRFVYAAVDYYSIVALNPGKNGSTVWQDNTFTPDVSSPVADEKFLFIATGSGDAACYNAEKGDTLWSHYFKEPFYASPIICDNKVWLLDREGNLHVVEAAGKLNFIATSPVGERTDCTPAFSEKRIYIRGKENLYCISQD